MNMDTVIQALQQFFGDYVVAVVVVTLALLWGVWYLATRFQSMKDKVEGIDSLPCSRHNIRLDSNERQIADTRALLSKIEGQLELLVQSTIDKGTQKIRRKSGATFSAKHSPRTLNENGQNLLRNCGGIQFLESNMPFFISKIEQLQPKTALDVEDMALAVLQANTNDDMFIPIKNWIYKAPAQEIKSPEGNVLKQEIDMDDILFVMSLPIRDRFLEQHPQINT